jgi:hypothetical protein
VSCAVYLFADLPGRGFYASYVFLPSLRRKSSHGQQFRIFQNHHEKIIAVVSDSTCDLPAVLTFHKQLRFQSVHCRYLSCALLMSVHILVEQFSRQTDFIIKSNTKCFELCSLCRNTVLTSWWWPPVSYYIHTEVQNLDQRRGRFFRFPVQDDPPPDSGTRRFGRCANDQPQCWTPSYLELGNGLSKKSSHPAEGSFDFAKPATSGTIQAKETASRHSCA